MFIVPHHKIQEKLQLESMELEFHGPVKLRVNKIGNSPNIFV